MSEGHQALVSYAEYLELTAREDEWKRKRFMGQLEDPNVMLERWVRDDRTGEWRIIRTSEEDEMSEALALAYWAP